MSSSRISSVRLTIVAPDARAIRLLSDFLTRRIAVIPALNVKRKLQVRENTVTLCKEVYLD